jgi:hypothetical protein
MNTCQIAASTWIEHHFRRMTGQVDGADRRFCEGPRVAAGRMCVGMLKEARDAQEQAHRESGRHDTEAG